ncbi:MAG: DUF4340 domain-containing protein [Clostridiales bacterium]|nr:DUF4340 domain-containing protein [Clostridiales bacterium]
MTKGLKRILIVGGIAVFFVVVLLVFKYAFPDKEVDVEVTPTATAAPVYYIVDESGNDLQQMICHYSDGGDLTVNFNRDANGALIYDVTPAADYFPWNTSKFRSMMFTVSSLTAMGLVEENPKDLSVYGLDDPYFSMTLKYPDTTINVYLGNATLDGYAYCYTDVGNTVYTMGSYLAGLISRQMIEYRQIDVFPKYEEDAIYENIDYVYMELRDGTPIEIVLDSEQNIEGNENLTAYMLLQPIVSSANDINVQEKVLDLVATITYVNIFGDIKEDQFAEFGFNKPARIRLEDTSGNVLDLTVGSTDGTNYYCCFTEQYEDFLAGEVDYLTVLLYSPAGFEWLDIKYMDLAVRTIWVQDIHDVKSIKYDMDGTVYTLEIENYDYVTDAGIDVQGVKGTFNGEEIEEVNIKRLYARTLDLREVGVIPDDVDIGKPQHVITLTLHDGRTRKLELYKLNERQYCAIVDNTIRYYIYQSNLQNIFTAFERLLDDRDLPLLYNT